MILLIDNYDSFSYNLFQLVGALNPDIRVVRNDLLSVPEIEALSPEAILLSRGLEDRQTPESAKKRYKSSAERSPF